MKQVVENHFSAFKSKLLEFILNSDWSNFYDLLEKFMVFYKKALDESLSPNTSNIIERFHNCFFDINDKLLNIKEFDKSIELIQEMFYRFNNRKIEKEIKTIYDTFLSIDRLNIDLIQRVYKIVEENKYLTFKELLQKMEFYSYIAKLIHLFNFKNSELNYIVSYFFETIYLNNTINSVQKSECILKALQLFNRYSQAFLADFPNSKKAYQMKDSNLFYILQTLAILRWSYLNDDIKAFQYVMSFKDPRNILALSNLNKNFSHIINTIVMFIITDVEHDYAYKVNFFNSEILHNRITYNNLIIYLRDEYINTNIPNEIWNSHNYMVEYVYHWHEIKQGFGSYDHTPELFLILFSAFFIKPDNYNNIFQKFLIPKNRFDRIDVYSREFIKCAEEKSKNKIFSKIFIDFIKTFEIDIHQEKMKIIYCFEQIFNITLDIYRNN